MHRLRLALALALILAPDLSYATEGEGDAVRLPPVSIAGAPRTLVSFVVPMPLELENSRDVRFAVERTGTAEVFGRMEGTLILVDGDTRRRQLLLTVRVPSDARVGLLDVADVSFTAADGRELVVPIILRIPSVRAVRVISPTLLSPLRSGDRVELAFVVENEGNGLESVLVEVMPPSGWVLRTPERVLVSIAPFDRREVVVRTVVPSQAYDGDTRLLVRAREVSTSDSAVVATASARLTVQQVANDGFGGLRISPYVAAVSSPLGGAVATGFALSGPIATDVRFSLHLQPQPFGSGGAIGLSAVGANRQQVQAAVIGKDWAVSGGLVGGELPVLTGTYVNGLGVSGRQTLGAADYSVLLAQPMPAQGRSGRVIAARASLATSAGRLGVSGSSLSEAVNDRVVRDLTAVGLDWTAPINDEWSFDVGTALRSTRGSTFGGFNTGILQVTERSRLQLSTVQSPGGQRAFANGTDNLRLEFRREVTERYGVDVAAARLRDDGLVIGQLQQRSLSLGQRLAIGNVSSVGLRLASSDLERTTGVGGSGGFGASQRSLELSAGSLVKRWNLTGSVRGGVIGRSTQLLDGRVSELRVPQYDVSARVARQIESIGSVSAGASHTMTGPGAGIPDRMTNLYGSLNAAPIAIGPQVFTFGTRLVMQGSSMRRNVINGDFSLRTVLPGNIELEGVVSRNGFIQVPGSNGIWSTALKLTTNTGFSFPRTLVKTAGVVFDDHNGNGVRDGGEPGIEGVVLRVNGIRMMTDEEGRYRLPPNVRGRLRLEPNSVPRGYVVNPAVSANMPERGDIPLRQTGGLVAILQLGASREGILPQVNLADVDVWLRDEQGYEWVGRTVEPGVMAFDGLPAGRYSFRLDASRAAEPVRLEEGVVVEVASRTTREITLTLRGRDIRMIAPPSRSGGTGGRGGSGRRGGAI